MAAAAAAAATAPVTGVKRKAADVDPDGDPDRACLQVVQNILGCTRAAAVAWLSRDPTSDEQKTREWIGHGVVQLQLIRSAVISCHVGLSTWPTCSFCDLTDAGRSISFRIIDALINLHGYDFRANLSILKTISFCIQRVVMQFVSGEDIQNSGLINALIDWYRAPPDVVLTAIERVSNRYLNYTNALGCAVAELNRAAVTALLARVDVDRSDAVDDAGIALTDSMVLSACDKVRVGWVNGGGERLDYSNDRQESATYIARAVRAKAKQVNASTAVAVLIHNTLRGVLLHDLCVVVSGYATRVIDV